MNSELIAIVLRVLSEFWRWANVINPDADRTTHEFPRIRGVSILGYGHLSNPVMTSERQSALCRASHPTTGCEVMYGDR